MKTDKYLFALQKEKIELSDKDLKQEVSRIISEKFEANNNIDVYRQLYGCIDLTSLNSTDSKENIWKLTQKINDFEGSHPDIPNVASICVFPNLVNIVKESLTADVSISSVAGAFPSSQTFIEVKLAEASLALADGADEIEMPINLGLFLENDLEEMCEEITEMKEVCKSKVLKVILETGALKNSNLIDNAAILALYSGADFIKTSTGKDYSGATPEAVLIICRAIKSYYKKYGIKVGIKVSGGVSNRKDAIIYYTIVKEILGDEWCNKNLFRIGSSSLADALLTDI